MATIPSIRHPLPGEQVLALSPDGAEEAARTWRRRPNLLPGRSLTATALKIRQGWAAGQGTLLGQTRTAGVIRGLELERLSGVTATEPGRSRLSVSAGHGLAVSGEDVVLPHAVEFALEDVPVVWEGRIGEPLGRWRAAVPDLPRAGVIVLQPVQFERSSVDEHDPCDRCPCGEGDVSLEDWRLVDGARLLWFAWPDDFGRGSLLTPGLPFRNQLAWAVFEAEERLAEAESLPWERFGVPLALIGLDGDLAPTFVDRPAVVRRGGLERTPRFGYGEGGTLMSSWRLPGLWQARLEQVSAHMLDLLDGSDREPGAVIEEAIDRWPPSGILPRWSVDLEARRVELFPPGFLLDAVPVPVEEVDPIIRDSAGLAPLSASRSERVQLLVPVAAALYDPRLLHSEELDPLFSQTLERFLLNRARALATRQTLQRRAAVLSEAISGSRESVLPIGADPLAPEPEASPIWPLPPGREGRRLGPQAGSIRRRFEASPLTVEEGERPYLWLCLDPERPVQTLLLHWDLGDRGVTAVWGGHQGIPSEQALTGGTDMGALPPSGQWIRVSVPLGLVPLGSRLEALEILVDAGTTAGAVALASTGLLEADGAEREWRGETAAVLAGPLNGDDHLLDAADMAAPFEERFGVVLATPSDDPSELRSQTLEALIANPSLAFLSEPERDRIRLQGVAAGIAYLKDRADRLDDHIDAGFLRFQTDAYRLRQMVLDTTEASRLLISPALAGIARAETATATQTQLSDYLNGLQRTSGQALAGPTGSGTESGAAPRRLARAVPAGMTYNTVAGPRLSTEFAGLSPTTAERAEAIDPGSIRDPGRTGSSSEPGVSKETLPEERRIAAEPSGSARYTPTDISQAEPLLGNPFLRTTRIGQRITDSRAARAHGYAVSTRHGVVLGFSRLARTLALEDGEDPDSERCRFPAFLNQVRVPGFDDEPFLQPPQDGLLVRFAGADRDEMLALLGDLSFPSDGDEATLFSDVTVLGEHTVALLRQMEGKVQLYRDAITSCESALRQLQEQMAGLRLRLGASEEQLAQARHDVAVTRALTDEEQGRLATINERRRRILAEEVPFVAYRRPRMTDPREEAPSRSLAPGLLDAPVPTCLETHEDAPAELEAMLALVREAPATWFRPGAQLVEQLDGTDRLLRTIATSQWRGRSDRWKESLPLRGYARAASAPASQAGFDRGGALQALQQRQIVSLSRWRQVGARLDLERLAQENLLVVRREARQVVSLGDLIEGEHGKAHLARRAAEYLATISRISACLHAELSSVPAVLRLAWAEVLSSFDEAPSLRNLTALEGFAGLEHASRHRLQGLTDWLFDQLATQQHEAAELINDLVRVCLLLASHAPVGRLITGRVLRPVRPRPGTMIPLGSVDAAELRVGMKATLLRGSEVVARAVLEDVGREESRARVLSVAKTDVELGVDVRVQFSARFS